MSPLLFEPARSTPLARDDRDEAEDPVVPHVVLWAMEARKHSSWRPLPEAVIRRQIGSGTSTLYAIDDGPDHCMIARFVGTDSDGCAYCLVARITLDEFRALDGGALSPDDAFDGAHDLALSSVFESDAASNVVDVEHFRHISDVPADYLPPSPLIEFT